MKSQLLSLVILSVLTTVPAWAVPASVSWSGTFQAEQGDVPYLSAGSPYTVQVSFDTSTFSASGQWGVGEVNQVYTGDALWSVSWTDGSSYPGPASWTSPTTVGFHDGLDGSSWDQISVTTSDASRYISLSAFDNYSLFSGTSFASLPSFGLLGSHYGEYDSNRGVDLVWGFDPTMASATVPEPSVAQTLSSL